MSYYSLLLFSTLIALPFTFRAAGFVGIQSLAIAIFSLPFVVSLMNRREVLILTGIFYCAVTVSAISLFHFPDSYLEYAKSLISFGVAIFCGYVSFLLTRGMTRQQISSVCLLITSLFLTFSLAEIIIPQVRDLSIAIGTFQTQEFLLEGQGARDMIVHGGFLRPLCGTSEPSRVGLVLAIAITGWNLTRFKTPNSDFLLLLLLVTALVLTRSPTLIAALIAGNIGYFLSELRSGTLKGMILTILSVIAVIGSLVMILPRVELIMDGEDVSFNERIRLPINFTRISLWETYGLGFGFVGAFAEPGNPALNDFYPVVVEAAELSNSEALLKRYSKDENFKISISHSAFFTHWIYFGIPFGLIVIWLWRSFIRITNPRLVLPFFASFIALGVCAGGYETVGLWICQMLVFGFLAAEYRPFEEHRQFMPEIPPRHFHGNHETFA